MPFDRRLLFVDLLSQEERDWINDYHALVAAEISPLLEGAEKQWLEQATRPL